MQKHKYLLLALVLFAAVYFARSNLDEIKKIQNVRAETVLSLVVLNLLSRMTVGYRIKTVSRIYGIDIGFGEWFGVAAINSFYNYLLAKSGTLANAMYFGKKYGVSMPNYIVTFGSTHVFTLLACGIVGLPASVYAAGRGYPADALCALFLFLLAVPCVLIFFPDLEWKGGSTLQNKARSLLQGWSVLRRSKETCALLLLCELSNLLFFALRFYLAFQAFGYDLDFWVSLLLSPVTLLSGFIGITPAALGIREAAGGLLTRLLGFGMQAGVLATVLDRAVVMTIAFTLGPFFSYTLLKGIDAAPHKPQEKI
ncbi:MAG: flippase-like domain-containing protein [Nitrospinae bacterium]|nr:flippase-like domain-containing protein [Nitrospinota bacterium]